MIKFDKINLLKARLSKINFSRIKSVYVCESLRETGIASLLAVFLNIMLEKGEIGFKLVLTATVAIMVWYTGLMIDNKYINKNKK